MKIQLKIEDDGAHWLYLRGLDTGIAQAMGVGQRDSNISFNYESGAYQRVKHRNMNEKVFFITGEVPDDWVMPLFNQQNFKDKSYIIVTEGEFDAVAVAQMGYTNVVSLPLGIHSAEKSLKEHFKYICEYNKIYIYFDNDEQGQKTACKIKELLPKLKFRNVTTPFKDANDLLLSPNGIHDFPRFLEKAEKYEVATVIDMNEIKDDTFIEVDPGFSTGWRTFDEKIGGIRQGELTVLTGDTGCGKTSFAINLMYNLAAQHIPVYISSYEVTYVTIMKKLASHILKKPMCVVDFEQEDKEIYRDWVKDHRVFLNPTFGSSSLETILQEIEYASHVHGVKVVLLDHLHFFLNFDSTENERTAIDRTVRELVKCARNNNVHILLIVHPRQQKDDSGEISMAMLKGSSAIKQDSHNVLGIQRRDRIDPSDPKVIIKVMKNRAFGTEGPVYFYYNKEYGGYEHLLPDPQPKEPVSYSW